MTDKDQALSTSSTSFAQALAEQRLQRFKEAGYEEQIALFLQTLDEGKLMDETMASSMLKAIYRASAQQGRDEERLRFNGLVNQLRQKAPEAFNSYELMPWLINNALVVEEFDRVRDLFAEMIRLLNGSIGELKVVIAQLIYHDQLAIGIDAMRTVWAERKRSQRFWDARGFVKWLATYVILDDLQKMPSHNSSSLLNLITSTYKTLEQDILEEYLSYLTAKNKQRWAKNDFRVGGEHRFRYWYNERKSVDKATQNLFHLTVEFMAYLHDNEGITYAKAYLVGNGIYEYLLKRHTGMLANNPIMIQSLRQLPKRYFLVPDHDPLQYYINSQVNAIEYHQAAITFQMIPAWLQFLKSHSLINGRQHKKALNDVQRLQPKIIKIWEAMPEDPMLRQAAVIGRSKQ